MMRTKPNIIITGTPGVGKTSHSDILASSSELEHLSISHLVKERGWHEGWDPDKQSWIVDEDKLLDAVQDDLKEGGNIIDWHACDLFPKKYIDLVIVLRAKPSTLYDRLKERNYPEAKLQENLDAEIMEVLLAEAQEAYDNEIVVELHSNELEDVRSNIARIQSWLKDWKQNNAPGNDQPRE
ncbi:MAG: hypothetical protein Q9167_004029 [Letrouitia subvulpina]